MLRLVALAALLSALAPGVARGADPWRWPVEGEVVGSYSFDPAAPFAAGQRRGIAIAAPPGTVVRAACAGAVSFAGAVGRAGPTLSVRCGALTATYQGLGALRVDEGTTVRAGSPIAATGPGAVLRLGARRGETYVDPAGLLAARPPSLGPAPRRRPVRPPSASPPSLPPPRAAPRGSPAEGRQPSGAPPLAWLGLALLATGVPVGGLRRRGRHRRAARATTAAAAR